MLFLLNLSLLFRLFDARHRYEHFKAEETAFTTSFRGDLYVTAKLLDNLFHDCETQPDSFVIDLCSPIKLPEAREKFGKVMLVDAATRVSHMPLQLTFLSVVNKLDVYEALVGKLDRILD